jgi:hypothetical protein
VSIFVIGAGGVLYLKDYSFLGREEDMVGEYKLSYLPGIAWLNYYFGITNKRLIVNEPRKLLWIIPVGSNDETYALGNISSVRFKKNINVKKAAIGVVLLLLSLSDLSNLFILTAISMALIYASLEEKIIIQNNSGRVTSYFVSMFDRGKAKEFVSKLNRTIADNL